MEGELGGARRRAVHLPLLALLGALLLCALLPAAAADDSARPRVHLVLFTCVHGRAHLTDFVLGHYAHLSAALAADDDIDLDLFVTGSDAAETSRLAERHGAAHAVFPNSPLGAKHNRGLAALRDRYSAANTPPHAVVIIGSDDLLNRAFFLFAAARLGAPDPPLVLGLRDLYLYDLASAASGGRLAYTRGYRAPADPLAATVGCGRVFAWPLLERLRWELWDGSRDRSLDQSTVRRVAAALGTDGVAAATHAVRGSDFGVVAVDVKTASLAAGRNIWSYDDIISAGGAKLHRFRAVPSASFFDAHFGIGFEAEALRPLLDRMLAAAPQAGGGRDGATVDIDSGTCAVSRREPMALLASGAAM